MSMLHSFPRKSCLNAMPDKSVWKPKAEALQGDTGAFGPRLGWLEFWIGLTQCFVTLSPNKITKLDYISHHNLPGSGPDFHGHGRGTGWLPILLFPLRRPFVRLVAEQVDVCRWHRRGHQRRELQPVHSHLAQISLSHLVYKSSECPFHFKIWLRNHQKVLFTFGSGTEIIRRSCVNYTFSLKPVFKASLERLPTTTNKPHSAVEKTEVARIERDNLRAALVDSTTLHRWPCDLHCKPLLRYPFVSDEIYLISRFTL